MPRTGPEAAAIALFQAGRFDEAQSAFRGVLASDPRNVDALHALGLISLQAGRFEEAAELLRRAMAIDAGAFAIPYHLGTALRQAGRPEEALPAFRRAVSLNPVSADAHLGLGNTLRDLGQRVPARESFAMALRIAPTLTAAQYNLALVDVEQGNDAAAEAGFARLVERDAANAQAWLHLGLIAHRRGDAKAAVGHYQRALQARADYAPALANWGNALKDLGDLEGAMERYEQAIAADPGEAGAWLNSGSVAMERGDVGDARRRIGRALGVAPDSADAQYARGLLDLRAHDFERGWRGYARRFETRPPVASVRPPYRPPLESLPDVKRLAVRREQGLGDQVLFSTLLPELAGRGVQAVVELDPRLLAAYRRSVPGVEFPDPQSLPDAFVQCDHEVPIGSLGALFRPTAESFDRQPRALLKPDPLRVAGFREEIGDAKAVAISWRSLQGFGRRHIGERKSIPLECFGALAGAGLRLVDVQYGDLEEERRAFDAKWPGLRLGLEGLDTRDDIDGVLAAIEACELVVTSSNVTAHLAGAIGKPTWLVYLAANPPFHYWAPREDGRSLWYPSVEILTDAAWAQWPAALAAVARRLGERFGGG